ncbi:diphthamide biosynthesis enzyme Dph2 [Candidatus Micrarchaeota archaeon]|nr:diphthamide biosynthesis enzyme Dph2 [Candidatus Micrarchaeota archaeon]
MRILLQFPEGLKSKALEEQKELEKQGNEVFVSSASCYGACDLAIDEAKKVKADKIIHYGHAPFVGKTEIPVEYKEFHQDIDLELIKKHLGRIKNFTKIGLITTVQYIHQLDEIKQVLEKNHKEIFIGKGPKCFYKGQVLGCDTGAIDEILDKIECVLYIGGGKFHYLTLNYEIPVFIISPNGEFKRVNDEIQQYNKKLQGALLKSSEAKAFGILVSTKIGQFNLQGAEEAKKKLEEKGKSAVILISNEINHIALQNFNLFDAYINTACPRIIEDYERFEKPIININKLEELINFM